MKLHGSAVFIVFSNNKYDKIDMGLYVRLEKLYEN